MGGWVKHRADKCDKVAKSKYKGFVTSLERADKKTGWVGKKTYRPFADKRGKVAKLEYKSFVTSLERADKKTWWVGKKTYRPFAGKRDKLGMDGVPN